MISMSLGLGEDGIGRRSGRAKKGMGAVPERFCAVMDNARAKTRDKVTRGIFEQMRMECNNGS